jgi:hypothetical protein
VRLERDYLALQSRALAAPGSALEELRRLRQELLSLKRDRALAEVSARAAGLWPCWSRARGRGRPPRAAR